jgi:uncharacterized protein YwgA
LGIVGAYFLNVKVEFNFKEDGNFNIYGPVLSILEGQYVKEDNMYFCEVEEPNYYA